jgi:hypothetical protein
MGALCDFVCEPKVVDVWVTDPDFPDVFELDACALACLFDAIEVVEVA